MDWMLFPIFLAACALAAATGMLFAPGAWYQSLKKPDWTPPNLAFPIIWSGLYLLMALAAARLAAAGAVTALAFWALQLMLNALWSPVFFGLHRIRLGLWIIGALWLAVLATCVAAWKADPWAGAMLLPYLAWVSVAAALNRAVGRLNPGADGG